MQITTERAWNTFHLPIKRFVFKYTHDEDATEDLLQDIFLKIHMHIETLKDEKKLQSWLYQIARNTLYDHYRQHKGTAVSLAETSDIFDIPEEPSEEDVEQTLLPCIRELVEHLPEPYREAILLTEYQGYTQKKLAESLGISLSGAKSRVQRAREKMKEQLLECCHFEFDRRGKIIEYHRKKECDDTCGYPDTSCAPL